MKRHGKAFAMCQSMFCALPCPWRVWDEEARPLMLLYLPVLGLELGALWCALAWLLARLALPAPLAALLLCAYPIAVTGGIHLDGFMDVTDAVRSCGDAEKRRAILKDPHVGSFAVIACALLLLALYSCFSVRHAPSAALVLLPVVSRCGSALAVTLLRPMTTSQYAAQEKPKGLAPALAVMLALALGAGFLCSWRCGAALLAAALGYGLALLRGVRSLGGMNGDVAGYALTLSELFGVCAWALL